MKQKEAVQITLEELDKEAQRQQAEKEKEEMKKKANSARPSLIKRIGVGLLDFLFAGAIAAGLFFVAYLTLFKPLGYNEASATIFNSYRESGLFYTEDGSFDKLTLHYNEDKSAIANYDTPVTAFYTTNERAVADNKLQSYIDAKVASGYYILNESNECVIKEGTTNETLKPFLEEQYLAAVDYFYTDPALLAASKTTYSVMIWTIFISVYIATVAMYIVVPLIDKQNRTFAYMIGKLVTVNKTDMKPILKGKAILRSTIFIFINYISIITLYILLNDLTFVMLPLFINTVVLCVTKTNSGIHDYAVGSTVINRTLTNEFGILESVLGKKQD